MVRWIILAVLVVVISAAVPLAISYLPADVSQSIPAPRPEESTGPPPVIVVEGDPTHDFGIMSEQDEGNRSWVVRNDGEGPLRLRFIEKPCTCTGIRIGEDGQSMIEGETFVVEPGEQTNLTITWETRDKIGEFSTYARFATNDYENNPTITLSVNGMVSPAIVVQPSRFEFPGASSDEETTRSVLVYSPSHPEMTIVSGPKTSRPDHLVADIRPLTEEELTRFNDEQSAYFASQGHDHAEGEDPGHEHPSMEFARLSSGYMLSVTLKPGLPVGRLVDAVTLTTDHPTRPELEIPIGGQVVGPISATPERVYMPGVSSQEGRSMTVTLNVRNQDETEFTPQIPETLQEVVEVSVEPVEATAGEAGFRQYRMNIQALPGSKPGLYRGTLRVETDHPQAPEIKVPVELLVRGN